MLEGDLTAAERRRISLHAAINQGRHFATRRKPEHDHNPAALIFEIPDTPLATAALSEARATLSPAILAHSLRCWQWASALARHDKLTPDPEALFVACALHDIALGSAPDDHIGCFALLGAVTARSFVRDHGMGSIADTVAAAIARHMDSCTPKKFGPEATALHDAAHLDVVGLRINELDPSFIRDVIQEHPRDQFSREFGTLMRYERRVRPRSAAATLWKSGMRIPIALNPLDRRHTPRPE
ncbi:MAG: HD domain-containing protein [Alcaligenaceae bacterium]|nr:MAG: HD domain-containing protein [Alcaligenaceae bacterium]